jgi:glycosyltransferase involved in cell wall biosynthesis
MQLAQQVCESHVVTYRQRESGVLFLEDLLSQRHEDAIFVISWGFDVPKLAAKLKHYSVIYHAHSTGYGFQLPARIPIITVSRNSLGYWGQRSPHSLIYYLPNQISDEFTNLNQHRDIDVLLQARKSSRYLLQELVPALQQKYHVVVVDSYVDDLAKLFNRAKIYLYDSAEYWTLQGVSEGFGLQPMEAMACGCQVFSSVNGGLSDYLDPGFNCHKIAGYSKEHDLRRILTALSHSTLMTLTNDVLAEYRSQNIIQRLQIILTDINDFFDHQVSDSFVIQELTRKRLTQLHLQTMTKKLQTRLCKRKK